MHIMSIEKLHLPKSISGVHTTAPLPAAELANITRWAGPFAPLVHLLIIGLVLLSSFRLALITWQWPRVAATGIVPEILV